MSQIRIQVGPLTLEPADNRLAAPALLAWPMLVMVLRFAKRLPS